MGDVSYPPANLSSLQSAIASKADVSAIPQPATTPPMSEKTAPAIGTQPTRYALEDHQHGRLTSTTQATITSGNTATVMFTRSFVNEPGIDYKELPATAETTTPPASDTAASAQPTQSRVIAWTKGPTTRVPDAAATDYTGCVVRVWKAQTIPQNLATLLLSAVFNIFAASVVGTRFSIIAVARSDVA